VSGTVLPLRREGYGLSLAFPFDAGPEYVDGFEAGLLFARLDARPVEWRGTYHARNCEQLTRVADSLGYAVEWETTSDETWVFGTFLASLKGKR